MDCCGGDDGGGVGASGGGGFIPSSTPSGGPGFERSIIWVDLRVGPGGVGTEASPFSTVLAGISAVPDGGTIMVAGGDASGEAAGVLGSSSYNIRGLGGQDGSGGRVVELPLLEYSITTDTQRLSFHNVSVVLAHTGVDAGLTECFFEFCHSVSLLADGDGPTVFWVGDDTCTFSGSGGPATFRGGIVSGYVANNSGEITLIDAHITGNLTSTSSITINSGCSFGAGVTLDAPVIKIDSTSYFLAAAIGTTFTSTPVIQADFLGSTTGYVLTKQSDGTWAGATYPGGFSLPGGGTAGQVLESDGAGGAVWASDDVGSSITIATDRLMGRDTAGTGAFEEISVGGGVEFTGSQSIQRSALTGDVTASAGSNTTAIAANAVTDTKLRDSAALSVIGRSAASSGDPGDIVAGTDGYVLRRVGTAIAFAAIVAASITDGEVTLAKLADISSDRLLGRDTASAGPVEELTVGGGVEFTGSGGIQRSALTGDVTASAGSAATTIANNAVTYAKMQDVTATNRFIGRITAGSGDPEELTGTQATTLLDAFTSSLKGLAPASGGGTSNYLRADGTWGIPPGTAISSVTTDRLIGRDTAGTGAYEEISVGGGLEFTGSISIQRSALTGDVTATAGSNATTIANSAVTLAKMADIATDRLIGRDTAGTGAPEALAVTGGIVFTGSSSIQTTAFTGDVTKALGGTVLTHASNSVIDTVLRDSAGFSVIGKATTGTGDPADIVAGTDSVLGRNGSGNLAFGQVQTGMIATSAVTLAKMADIATDSLIGRDTAATGVPEVISVTGGIVFTGTGSIQTTAFTGDVTKSLGGTVLTLSANAVIDTALRDSAGFSVIGKATTGSGDPADIVAGTDTVLGRSGSGNLGFAQVQTGQIASDAVTYAKIQNVTATSRFLGRITAAAGDVEELTGTQATTLLDAFTSSLKGLAPASGGGTSNYLRADGTWGVPPGTTTLSSVTSDRLIGRDTAGAGVYEEISAGGGIEFTGSLSIQRSALTGDVTATAGSNTTTIATSAVTLAKMADLATDRLIGRDTVGTGAPESISVTGGIVFSGSGSIQTTAFTGDVTKALGGTVLTFTANAVVDTVLRDSAGFSVIGKATTGTGDPADIVAGTDSVLGRNGSGNLAFGQVQTGQIASDAVTYAKIQNVSATSRFLGRITAAAGDVEELTGAQATSLLDTFDAVTRGLVPLSGGGSSNYLRADGTWATPPGVPGGSTTQLQYNNAGVFDGASGIVVVGSETGLAFGTNPATAGTLRMPASAGSQIVFRNNANTANISGMFGGTDDVIYIGDQTNAVGMNLLVKSVTGFFNFYFGSTPDYQFGPSWINMTDNALIFGTNPAASGNVRGPNNTLLLAARNAANSADAGLLFLSSSDELLVGDLVVLNHVNRVKTGGTHRWLINDVDIMTLDVNKAFMKNSATAPTTDPSDGGYFYAESGAGKWRGSSGTVTTFGPAEPHCPRCDRDFAHEWESKKYGKLSVCMSCLVDALDRAGVPEEEFVIERKAA